MFKRLKSHLQDNSGDVYIQMLVCTTIMLMISVVIISVASSINTKLWLDEQLNDIVRIVENTGCIESPGIEEIEKSIQNRLGGEVTFRGTFINGDEDIGLVQLNDTVIVNYHCDEYVAVDIALFPIKTEIDLNKAATSNVYFKLEDTLIDKD